MAGPHGAGPCNPCVVPESPNACPPGAGREGKGERPMKASDLLVRCLEEEGVQRIYGVPGEENADFMMSLEDSPIEFVL